MLGVKSPNEMITGQFAESIREQVRRISTHNLNAADHQEISRRHRRRSNSQYSVVWEN